MKSLLRAVVFLITCFLIVGAAWAAATDAVFLSVSGKVSVKDTGGKSRTVKNNSTAAEGETVQVEKGGEATLVFFDGSTLDAKSNTQFILSALRKPSPNEKKLRFNLDFGALMARVQKLMTASSQFEIQAGGIVCGVRGTEFSVVYDPTMGSVDLKVIEGSVYAKTGGIITTVPAGQERKFLNGMPLVHADGDSSVMGPGKTSLALEDLNDQFTGILSVNGNGGLKAPTLGSSLQSGYQLIGGVGTVGIPLPALPLKLGP